MSRTLSTEVVLMLGSVLVPVVALAVQPETDWYKSVIDEPHPLITEVLFRVPPGDDGDAFPDGNRDATGDEFVELHNPHDRTIDLQGYTLSDRNRGGQGEVTFTFPRFRLKPGETVVVFNGNGQSASGVGRAERAPVTKHDELGCYVFVMGNESKYSAFSNSGDWVLLSDPDDNPVHVVHWGEFKEKLPNAELVETIVSEGDGSACRWYPGGPLAPHTQVDGQDMSPGEFPVGPTPEEAAANAALGERKGGG
ncbi:MAG: lamin tail domain-containing protein [Planctomycetota bacterium]